MKSKLMFLSVFSLTLFITLSVLSQDNSEKSVGVIAKFYGQVERFRDKATRGEPITKATKDLSIRHGDSIRTGKDGFIKISLSDGSITTLGPNAITNYKKLKEKIRVEVPMGKVRIDTKSDIVTLSTKDYTITGTTGVETSFEINVSETNAAVVFCIEGRITVIDQNNFQVFLGEGQKVDVKYDETKRETSLKAHTFNEESVTCRANDNNEYAIQPGGKFFIDINLNVKTKDEPTVKKPVKPVVIIKLPEIEEPEDEPYEDTGDFEQEIVSPKKPTK
ncbi:MAG: FecR domain-containing protein [Planctomycetota bacterium]